MSILVPINGVNYIIPTPGETGWGSNLDSFFVAISAGCLQKIGGNFLLSNEVDFGAAFGLKSLYYKAETGTVATTGTIRLANADPGVVFRNNANSGNLALTTDSLDRLTYNGIPISTSGGIIELPDGSAGTPSLVFASDTPTGWYKSGIGQWAFSSEGTNTWTFGTVASQFLATASASLNNSLIGLRAINTSSGTLAEAAIDVAAGTGGCGILSSGSGNTDTYMGIPKANTSQFRSDSGGAGLFISTAGGGGPIYIGTSGILAATIDASQQFSFVGQTTTFSKSVDGNTSLIIQNANTGTSALAFTDYLNNASDSLIMGIAGGNYSATLYGISLSHAAIINNNVGSAGMFINTGTGPIYIGTVSTKALTVDTSQILTVEKTAVFSTGLSSSGNIILASQHAIVYQDAAGSPKSVTVEAPAAVTTSYTVKWPITQGASNQYLTNDGSGNLSWTNAAGTGTVNTGTQFQLAYYATSTNTVSGLTLITASSALASDANGLPVASTTTAAELAFVHGVTSAIQTQINAKAPSANPTFTGQVLLANGSVSAPAVAFTNSTGSGLYRIGADDIGLATNGILALEVTATQQINIPNGITATAITINGTTNGPAVFKTNSTDNNSLLIDNNGGSSHGTLYSIRFNGATKIAIGTDSGYQGATTDQGLSFATLTAAGFRWYINSSSTASMALDSSGNLDVAVLNHSSGTAIRGTNTNNNATAGDVGETIESVVAGVSFPASTNYGDLTSITLTAGDWLVTGAMEVATGAAQNTTVAIIGISQTTGNSSTGLVSGSNLFQLDSNVGATALNSAPLFVPSYRQSLSGSTIIYLKFRASYSGTTPTASGRITAVRIR